MKINLTREEAKFIIKLLLSVKYNEPKKDIIRGTVVSKINDAYIDDLYS